MAEKISDCDHTYLKTRDNIYFAVNGDLHTSESIFGQPYYFPKKTIETILDRQIQKTTLLEKSEFCKLLDVIKLEEYPDFIKENFSKYYYSPKIWPLLMKVNRSNVSRVFNPKIGLDTIYEAHKHQENHPLIYFLELLKQHNPALYKNMGITGSLLLHQDLSQVKNDIDIIVYGRPNAIVTKSFSINMCDFNNRFSFLEGEKLETYLDSKAQTYPGTRKQLADLTRKWWDTFYIDETRFDLTFSSETTPPLESYDLLPLGERKISGEVTDTDDSYFLPTGLKVRTSSGVKDVIITSRGYISLFEKSDSVEVTGEEYLYKNTGKRYTVVKGLNKYFVNKKWLKKILKFY